MNQSTSFHVRTISTLFRMELISRVSYDIECLLTCQAVDFVIKTTFLPGKLPGQLTTHSSSLNLLSLTHMIATANWLHKCCILYTECSMCLSHSTTKDILNSTLYKKTENNFDTLRPKVSSALKSWNRGNGSTVRNGSFQNVGCWELYESRGDKRGLRWASSNLYNHAWRKADAHFFFNILEFCS